MDKIAVSVFGIIGILFTYWFFLMRKEDMVIAEREADILVDGGYNPEVLSVPVGKALKLNFIRKDPSSCLEEVILGDFKIRKYLPLDKKVTVEITPKKKGTFKFTCGMNMYHGKIIVR